MIGFDNRSRQYVQGVASLKTLKTREKPISVIKHTILSPYYAIRDFIDSAFAVRGFSFAV